LAVLLGTCAAARAQAGPPFRTDDPETPGNKHWEINIGFLGDRSPADGDYEVPDLDLNYGLGDRIQLKYELPAAIHEDRAGGSVHAVSGQGGAAAHSPDNKTVGGLGESLLGIKYRFYQHMPAAEPEDAPAGAARKTGPGADTGADTGVATEPDAPEPNFSISTYPQLSLNNPTHAVARGVVAAGPQFLLPVEMNARIGWLRLDGEAGYWFTNRHVPQAWIRGMIAGHEFTPATELYAEIYDQQDANRVDGQPKAREATIGAGGRHALNRGRNVILLFMAGRSLQATATTSTQPSWLAYVGVQFLLSPGKASGASTVLGTAAAALGTASPGQTY